MECLMAGRPKTQYHPIFRTLHATLEDGTTFSLTKIPVLCPKCESQLVGPYGTQPDGDGGDEKFQCKDPDCPFLKHHAHGHQFNIRTSARFQQALAAYLTNILAPLVSGTMSQSVLAGQIHRSPALVTYLRHKVEARLQELDQLQKLVLNPTLEDAVALDEFFLTIEGRGCMSSSRRGTACARSLA